MNGWKATLTVPFAALGLWSISPPALALSAGTGVDVVLTRALAWRVANLEYTHSWISNADQIHANDGLRIATEFVLRIGTW